MVLEAAFRLEALFCWALLSTNKEADFLLCSKSLSSKEAMCKGGTRGDDFNREGNFSALEVCS